MFKLKEDDSKIVRWVKNYFIGRAGWKRYAQEFEEKLVREPYIAYLIKERDQFMDQAKALRQKWADVDTELQRTKHEFEKYKRNIISTE